MEDENMENVVADIEEVCYVILALMPRLHTALVKRECEGCTIYHPANSTPISGPRGRTKKQKSGSTRVWQMYW